MFTVLLSFSISLATKRMSLNNEPCITRPFLIDINSVKFKRYPFMINLDKWSRSCNAVDNLSTKTCSRVKQKV